LIVGGGYIAVECASFLQEMGNEVIMVNRSTFLRAFDTDMADRIMGSLTDNGVKALQSTVITKITKVEDCDSTGKRCLEVDLLTDGS